MEMVLLSDLVCKYPGALLAPGFPRYAEFPSFSRPAPGRSEGGRPRVRLVEHLADVLHLDREAAAPHPAREVHHAGGAFCGEARGPRLPDVVHLPVQDPCRLGVVKEGVAAGRATAPVGLGHLLVSDAGEALQQRSWLGGDLREPVREVARVVIGDGALDLSRAPAQPLDREELAEAFRLPAQSRRLLGVGGILREALAVVLEEGAAAAAVRDDRVEL